MPLMASPCATCVFNPDARDVHGAATIDRIQVMVLSGASQTCHHSGGIGKRDTHLCRGGRDFQLTIFFRMGLLSAPTDEAWDERCRSLGIVNGTLPSKGRRGRSFPSTDDAPVHIAGASVVSGGTE